MRRRSMFGIGLLAVSISACGSGPTEAETQPALQFSAAILGGTPLVWDGNGNAYDAISVPEGITFIEARDAVAAATLDGCAGYLATLTTLEENQFIVENLPHAMPPGRRGFWLGGWQPPGSPEPAGGWTWLNGDAFEFANWNSPAEPNNWYGREDALHLWDDGTGRWNDLASDQRTPGYVVEYDAACAASVTEIMIGVAPGRRDTPRPINPRSWGVVTVVVFSSSVAAGEPSDFDASQVDLETVTLGDGVAPEAEVARRSNGTSMDRLHDVDGDGDSDLVLQFRIRDLQENGDIAPGTAQLTLAGQTDSGQPFSGSNSIRLVP